MESIGVNKFREEVEGWLNFNKNRGNLNLLDLSQLIAIFEQYYKLKPKKSK